MLKTLKYCFVVSSIILLLFVSSGSGNSIPPNSPDDFDNGPSPSLLGSADKLICILPQNEPTFSVAQSNAKTSTTKPLRSFYDNNGLLKPEYSDFLHASEDQKLSQTYHRQILFPFHFFL